MTVAEIKASTAEFLTAEQIAPVLSANPDTIRRQAREAPELLRFPVTVIGRRVRFPRLAFLKFMGVE